MDCVPDVAGMMRIPCGPSTIASLSSHSPAKTWPRLRLGRMPSITSTLARPKSASSTMTFLPCFAIQIAMPKVTFDFPTPPLPPVTEITLVTDGWVKRRRPLAWSYIILFVIPVRRLESL
ncbi:Uncharacterised protein [Vibrio cholerae]|nr:Uncharacterised protein [Vibrio cholerae]